MVAGVQRLEDAGLSPHWPSRLLLHGNGRRQFTRALIRPKRVPAQLPHGPLPAPSGFDEATPATVTATAINDAIDAWHKEARKEWASLIGFSLGSPAHCFWWSPAVGPLASQECGNTRISTLWRSVALRFDEVACIAERRRPGGYEGVQLVRP